MNKIDLNNIHKDNLLWLNKYKRYMTKKGLGKNTIYNYYTDLVQWLRFVCDHQGNIS